MSEGSTRGDRRDAPATSGRRGGKSSGSGRGGPRASVACVNCRQKKTKCDAQKTEPGKRCTMCCTLDIECILIRNDDRRKYGSREHIAALQGRIHSIEAMIIDCNFIREGQFAPRRRSEPFADYIVADGGSDTRECQDTIRVGPQNARTPLSLSGSEELGMPENEAPGNNGSDGAELNTSAFGSDHGETQSYSHDEPPLSDQRAGILGDHSSRTIAPYLSPSVEDSGPRLDADSRSGQVRYYGPTTNLHIQSPSESRKEVPLNPTFRSESVVNMDSPKLRNVLIESCWNYYARSQQVVDKQLFTAHRKIGKRSQYYAPFLENVMLACATRTSTSEAVRKLGRPYAERAKKDVVFELEQPTIATLQGFLLLSDFEATMARDRVGWMYSGIACRLLFDLGLHQDCSQLVENGILSAEDARLRKMLCLGAFVFDKLWALYLGRPSCIPASAVDPAMALTIDTDESSTSTLGSWVTLAHRISDVSDILNAGDALLDRSALDRLSELGAKILASYDAMPWEISSKHCEITELDAVTYGLNIQFCGIQIVLHRALVKALCQKPGHHPDDCIARIENSRAFMREKATTICRLMLAYREIFGVQNIITVMLDNMYVAASTLISCTVHPPVNFPPTDDTQLLNFLADTMAAVEKHYPVAEKMRNTLSRITRNTKLEGMFGPVDAVPAVAEPPSAQLPGASMMPAPGLWGSMAALMSDDFLLGNGMEGTQPDATLGDNTWLSQLDMGILP